MSHFLDRLTFFKKQVDTFSDGHGIVTNEPREWEDGYRKRWQHDKIVRSTHGVNCTGSCSWKIYVKGGIVTWETQQTDYPRTRPDLPNHEPRGCARGASYSWYLYSANRVKHPMVRGRLLKLWREARATLTPVAAWASIVESPEKRASYTSKRGLGGLTQGASGVAVRRRPRVTLLSSGKELRGLGDSLAPGQIHDSNMPMLSALLTVWGADVRPMSVVADDALSMQAALREAAEHADLVLTTAGISVGDEDHVRDALQALGGDLAVLKVAMKPGKPLAAGRLGGAVFIGLPGNPMAALAGAVGFVQPALARMAGTPATKPLRAYAGFDMRRKMGRAEFIAVRLLQRVACLWAERTGSDGSGRLAPLLTSDAFVFLPAGMGDVGQGDRLQVLPFMPCAIKPGLEADRG